jgi:hypothetical protein
MLSAPDHEANPISARELRHEELFATAERLGVLSSIGSRDFRDGS